MTVRAKKNTKPESDNSTVYTDTPDMNDNNTIALHYNDENEGEICE